MQLTSVIVVKQSRQQVWEFLSLPANTPEWNRNVAAVTPQQPGKEITEGTVVDAVDRQGHKESYRITKFDRGRAMELCAVNSGMFKKAAVQFTLERVMDGTQITHNISFRLRLWFLLTHPLLLLSGRQAFTTDMEDLRQALVRVYKTAPQQHRVAV